MTLLEEIILKVAPEILATRDTQAITDALNVGRVKRQFTQVGRGLILEVMGMDAGNSFLDTLQAIPEFRHVWPLIETGTLELMSGRLEESMTMLVNANALTLADAEALLALAEVPDPAAEFDVRCALFHPITGAFLA